MPMYLKYVVVPLKRRLDVDEMTLFREFGEKLLASPAPGAVTDYKQARLLEATTPNVFNAWTHVVPALANMLRMKENGAFLDVIRGKQPTENSLKNFDLLFLGFTEMGCYRKV